MSAVVLWNAIQSRTSTAHHCGTHVYSLTGTTFEKSRTPLKPWCYAMYLSLCAKHLQYHVNEYAFQYNHRNDALVVYKTTQQRLTQVRHGRHGKYAPIGPATPQLEASDAK